MVKLTHYIKIIRYQGCKYFQKRHWHVLYAILAWVVIENIFKILSLILNLNELVSDLFLILLKLLKLNQNNSNKFR